MLERKLLNPNLLEITQTEMSFSGTKVSKYYYVCLQGVWHRVHNDCLQTAYQVLEGGHSKWVRPVEGSALEWLERNHLPNAVVAY